MIRIYVFIDGQVGNQTNTNAQNAWWALKNHQQAENIYVVDAANPDNAKFIQQFQVYGFPTIVFVKMQGETIGKTITRIDGPANEQQIQQVFNDVLSGKYGFGTGDGSTPSPITGDDEDLSLGLGLGLGGDVGKILMWLIVGYGVYKFRQNKR